MQTIFENGNVIRHTRKIYTMYGNLNGQLNYLGSGYVFWYLTISALSAETKHMGCCFSIYSLIMDIHNSFMYIHKSFIDIHNSF